MTNISNIQASEIKANGGFRQMLEEGFVECKLTSGLENRMEFLTDYIFGFTLYDSAMAEIFGQKAIEVCRAITEKTTFEFIENTGNHQWFLVMCHMPFFATRIEWGTSIQGAWWGTGGNRLTYESTGLFLDGDQIIDPIEFNLGEWNEFVLAIVEFAEKKQ